MDEPDVRVGVPTSRQGTIHTGASWMCVAKYSAASSSRRNRSRLMPGAGSPDRYRGATCSSHARLYKAPTVSLTLGSRITRSTEEQHARIDAVAHPAGAGRANQAEHT